MNMHKYRFIVLNLILGFIFTSGVIGHQLESRPVNQTDFLKNMNLTFNKWDYKDVSMTIGDYKILEPDSSLIRNFKSSNGDELQLAIVAGHRKKTIHTPIFCMTGGGWEIVTQRSVNLHAGDQLIPATQVLLAQNKTYILATYFFTNGFYHTSNLLSFQFVQILNKYKMSTPTGALVRIITSASNENKSKQITEEFANTAIPVILKELRDHPSN